MSKAYRLALLLPIAATPSFAQTRAQIGGAGVVLRAVLSPGGDILSGAGALSLPAAISLGGTLAAPAPLLSAAAPAPLALAAVPVAVPASAAQEESSSRPQRTVPAAGAIPASRNTAANSGSTGAAGAPVPEVLALQSVGDLTGSQADPRALAARLEAVYAGAPETPRGAVHVGDAVGSFGPSGFSSVGVVNLLPGNGRAGISAPGGRFREMDVDGLFKSVESLAVSPSTEKHENRPFWRTLVLDAVWCAFASISRRIAAATGRGGKTSGFILRVGDPVRTDRFPGVGVVRAIFENGFVIVDFQEYRYLGTGIRAAPNPRARYAVSTPLTIEAKHLVKAAEVLP